MKKILLATVILFFSSNSFALSVTDSVDLKGFVSQSFVYSQENPFMSNYTLKNGSFDFREAGLNLNWQIQPNLRFNVQGLVKQNGSMNVSSPSLDLALIDYSFYQTAGFYAGVRVGRVKTPYGLYNATRDLPSTRPSVLLPKLYFDSLRDIMLSTDGVNFYAESDNDWGRVTFDAFKGQRSIQDSTLEYQYLRVDYKQGEFNQLDKQGLRVFYEPKAIPNLTLGYSLLNLTSDYYASIPAIGSNPAFNITLGFDAVFHLISAEYRYKDFIFSAEGARGKINLNFNYAGQKYTHNSPNEGYYLQAAWEANPQLKLLIRYDDSKADLNIPNGGNPENYAKVTTVGFNANLTPEWLLSGEYSWHKGTSIIPIFKQLDTQSLKTSWQTFLLQLSYQF